jgi:hypothetical protein
MESHKIHVPNHQAANSCPHLRILVYHPPIQLLVSSAPEDLLRFTRRFAGGTTPGPPFFMQKTLENVWSMDGEGLKSNQSFSDFLGLI